MVDPQPTQPEPAAATPYGGWATIGLGVLVGAAFTAIQAVVTFIYVIARGLPDSARGLEELLGEVTYNGLIVASATCATSVLCTLIVVFIVSQRRGIRVKDYLAFKALSLWKLALWALGVLALVLLSDWLTKASGRPVVPDVILDIYRTASFAPLLWFAVIVAAPIFEEIFFRGFLFKGLCHSRVRSVGAILLTSLLWAAIHVQYDLWGLGIVFVLGIYFGIVRLKTGSIYATISLHVLVNLFATIETVSMLGQETSGIGV